MDEILEILVNDARVTPREISKMTGKQKRVLKKQYRNMKKMERSLNTKP